MNISIIGAGNVAWHLAQALEKADCNINEVYSRDIAKAEELAEILYSTKAVNSFDFSRSNSEIFFICVSDNAIASVASQLILPEEAIVVHTSGTQPLQALDTVEAYKGVFYPLQTFSKEVKIDFSDIPLLIEANNNQVLLKLKDIARRISKKVLQVSSKDRLVYHVGAVFSCNFANHLWAMSKEILESENLDFEILKPLIAETVNKMLHSKHPAEVQTGPAVRNDTKTIFKHKDFLQDDEDLLKVYTTLTESISDWHRID